MSEEKETNGLINDLQRKVDRLEKIVYVYIIVNLPEVLKNLLDVIF